MNFNSEVCGLLIVNCFFRSLKGKASINLVNKLYFLVYKVQHSCQQTFFVTAKKKKHELGEENDTCVLFKSYYSYENVLYFIRKMRHLSRNGRGQGIKN